MYIMFAHKSHIHAHIQCRPLTIGEDHVKARIAGTIWVEGGEGLVVGKAVAEDAVFGVDGNVKRHPVGGGLVDEEVGQVEEESAPRPILAPFGKFVELDETGAQGDGFFGRHDGGGSNNGSERAGDGKGLGEHHDGGAT